ncbi:glycosyltransferase [Ideonella sp. DXS29W]|uniref:Glycosyltransferase n=1 Tax=Ideonella lacteola TaxID=2984193 RepID=A0ABU9BHL7_9BURK
MPATVNAALVPEKPPADGPHLLDATMFWAPQGCGGVRRVISTKRGALVSRGWRHTLLAPGVQGPGFVDSGGWTLPGSGGYRFVADRKRAARLIEQAAPDIIESADPFTLAWSTLDAARALQVPTVAFCHSNLPDMVAHWVGDRLARRGYGRWAARQAQRYLARVYAGFDLVLAPSLGMTEMLRSLGVRHARHQPLGVSTKVFRPEAADASWRRALLHRLGLAPHTRLLVYSGRFAPEKNLELLAQAVELLGPGHVLIAMGAGPRPPRGRRVITFPPQHDDAKLARLLASGDAFVHAGDQETFGLAALEAMACGTPLVTSAHAGLGELVDGVGRTLTSRRPADWAEAIRATLVSRDHASIRIGLERARSHDWTAVIDGLSQRYLRLLERGALDTDSSHLTRPLLLSGGREWTAV